MKKIDLSYKDDAENWAYDIECLPSLFTSTFWNNDTAILWFFGSKAYHSVTHICVHRLFERPLPP